MAHTPIHHKPKQQGYDRDVARSQARVILLLVAGGLVAGGLAAPFTFARKRPNPIWGNVKSKRHHTVVAVSADGAAATVRASPFRLIPASGRFRLEIRGPDGSYQGPVVAAGTGRRVVVGFRAGARLGPVVQRHGYWVLRRALPRRFQDRASTARAVRGAPIGVRTLGLVSSAASGPAGRGRDEDRDGIPGAFDVDVDGDRVLNNVDAGLPTQFSPGAPYQVMWLLSVGLKQSFLAEQMGALQGVAGYALNVNASPPTMTTQQFQAIADYAAQVRGMLVFTLPADGTPLELDCGGLSYCSGFASTGRDITQYRRFPQDFDPDGDGFGTMEPTALPLNPQRDGIGVAERLGPGAKVFVLKPGTPHFTDVGAGDTYIERGPHTQQPVMLNYTFGTVPAMAAWSDGTRTQAISYPVPASSPGTEALPYQTRQYPNGTLTFTVWRPQRRAFTAAGEPGDWTDVGHLLYTVAGYLQGPAGGDRVWTCPSSAYSSPQMRVEPGGLRDPRGDAPVDRAQTLTFSADIGACLRHSGIDPATAGPSAIYFTASSDLGDAAEGGGFSFAGAPAPAPTPTPPAAVGGTWNYRDSTGTLIEWNVEATSFAVDHFGVKIQFAPNPDTITGGTSPPGWTCSVRQADTWYCTGSTLTPGSPVSGTLTLAQADPYSALLAVGPSSPGGSDAANSMAYRQ
jgi:hypothetical protein